MEEKLNLDEGAQQLSSGRVVMIAEAEYRGLERKSLTGNQSWGAYVDLLDEGEGPYRKPVSIISYLL